jgi:NADH:ubiquinone oxidoreductase subunit H
MFRTLFSLVSYVRRFICSLLRGILFLMGWSAIFGALFMA